jgi:LysR family transcriptional regulator, low CO2-responsive transcriptional regulator
MKLDNRISLQKLEAFCLVVRLGSVSRAAEKLFVTQPVVSAHLHSLQDRIGAPLLQRVGRGLELTEAGEAVHAWAEDLLRRRDDLSQELQDMADGVAGAVHLGSSMSVGNYLLPPVLMQFRRDNPGARISLAISAPELAVEAVEMGRTDFCVVASFGTVDTDRLEARLIGKQRFALVAAPTDPELPDSVDIEQLHRLPFVCPPGGQAIRRSQDAALAALGVTHRNVVIELGSAEAMKQAVQGHLGVALLWESSVAADLEEGRLREIQIEAPDMTDSLYVLRLAGKRFSSLQQKLYDQVSAALSGSVAGRALQPTG